MSNQEDTQPGNKYAEKYNKAEGKFDGLWAKIGSSPHTLGAFVVYTVLLVAFGFWVGKT